MFRTLLSLLLVFTLVSCNDAKISEADIPKQAQIALSAESPLGQFLASSNKSAVIKFYAEWCSTCEKYEPTYKKVAASMGNAVDFYEVDVDDSQYKELLRQLKISRIPETVFINKDRTNITKKLGSIPSVKLEQLISSQLI
jgi:thiol-disulfide isomerase/thioredoxin